MGHQRYHQYRYHIGTDYHVENIGTDDHVGDIDTDDTLEI